MNKELSFYVNHLGLLPHPEGGFYKETYRSSESVSQKALPERFLGDRSFSTGIYFLLEQNNFSAFHKIKSDEMWHFYAGDQLEVIEISPLGELKITTLGNKINEDCCFQHVVPANTFFASRVKKPGAYSLVGCTVSPGFDFADFDLVSRAELTALFPKHESIIKELTRF